ncbi:MAG: hypothetical protein IGS03_15125 [Candidatus Sericytochromatia bacterium]|nr:hypothetical protein [Candidatus Sericytochromatia bacterium]
MTQIGPRFSTQDNLQQVRHNRQDNKVNLSQPQGVAGSTAVEDLQGALNTQSNEVLIATDIQQNGQVQYMVLTRAEAESLLSELETLAQNQESIELSDIQFPASVRQRHGSETSNQNAQLVQNLYQDKSTFNLKLGPAELKNNAIHLNRHYEKRLGQVNQNLQQLDTQLQNVQSQIEQLETSGENPAELQQLKQEQQLLQGLKGLLTSQQSILQQQSQIGYTWNKQPTPPEQLTQLEQLAEQLQTQVGEMQTLLQNNPVSDPRLGAQLQMLTEQAGTMGQHLADCVNYCQDPEMSSARTVVDKELNLNAVMRDYENTLDLIGAGRRVAPNGFPPETPDLQGFKNSTLNDQSYSQAYQRVFSSWNQEIGAVDFEQMLTAPDGEAQLSQLRAEMAAKIDAQFTGPDGYVIAASKVAQVKKLFDDHIMSGHALALAASAGTLPRPDENEIQQALDVTRFGEAALPQHHVAVADNTRVVQPLNPELVTLSDPTPSVPQPTELQQQTTRAAINNHTAKTILPTLTGEVPTGFGKPAQNGLNQVHNGTQQTITRTEEQIQNNHYALRDHYKVGNLTLDSLPSEVRLDMEQDFIEGVVQDQDQDLSISMTHKDWPPLGSVRENIGDFGQAYNTELQQLMENAEVGSDAHTFMRCMQALELYEDPEYRDQIDYDQLMNNIADLRVKLAGDFAACEKRAMKSVFGSPQQQQQRANELKQQMLSENFIQRLSVLPPTQAQQEIKEAMSLLQMLNPQEDLGALSNQLLTGMMINNPGQIMEQLPPVEQKNVMSQTEELFAALDPETQQKILHELESALGIELQEEPPPDALKSGMKGTNKMVAKHIHNYGKVLKALEKDAQLLTRLNKAGATGAFGGLLSAATLMYSGVGMDKESISGMCSALSKVDDCGKVINTISELSSGNRLLNVGANAAKVAKFMKFLGPVGETISAVSTAQGAYQDWSNGDNVGAAFKGLGVAASGTAAIAGTYALCVASSGPAAPVVALVGGIVALAAWGLDEWLGESEQETIIRQAGCEKEPPPSPPDAEREWEHIQNDPFYGNRMKI